MTSAYTTATHEASVGVNKPAVNPLKISSRRLIFAANLTALAATRLALALVIESF